MSYFDFNKSGHADRNRQLFYFMFPVKNEYNFFIVWKVIIRQINRVFKNKKNKTAKAKFWGKIL